MPKSKTPVDAADLRSVLKEMLDYDEKSGNFYWRRPAGGVSSNGYSYIKIGDKQHLAHRLAWLYIHGEWPESLIDHVNGDRSDNRIANLRKASYSQNGANAKLHKRNTSGIKGVSFDVTKNTWQATITVKNKQIHLGRFHTKEEARAAYMAAAKLYHGEFASDGNHAKNVVPIKGVA